MSEPADTSIRKRSLSIAGHRTSVSVEPPFWDELTRLSQERGMSVQALVTEIDRNRCGKNLSSAIRLYVLAALKAADPRLT